MVVRSVRKARVGLYSAGLKAYWAQFDGLEARLRVYNRFIEANLNKDADVFNFGLVDTEDAARDAGEFFNRSNVDIVLLHSATYFTSSLALPVHQICTAPVIVLNLQPAAQMNYARTDTGEWLAQCVGCPMPETANAFERAGIRARFVNGLLGLPEAPDGAMADEATENHPSAVRAWREIRDWVRAAGVVGAFRHARFGFLGNTYCGMLDMYSDFTQLSAKLGLFVDILEMCDLDQHLKRVTPDEIQTKLREIDEFFAISGDSPSDPRVKKPTEAQLHWAAQVAAAQERMVIQRRLDALTYYYHSAEGNPYEQLQGGFIVGHSLLTASGVPCAGEGDLKTGIAMKICDMLGTGGSYTEIVAMDYVLGTMLLGHDGPFHIKISDGKPVLRGMGVYHGKKGSGISVEANVISGPVTTLGLTQLRDGRLRFIVSEGEAVRHPILTVGNTQTHVDFGLDLDRYMDEWFAMAPTHHCALSVGHNASLFAKVAELFGIECVRVGK